MIRFFNQIAINAVDLRRQQIQNRQQFFRAAVEAGLINRGTDAVRPPISPIARPTEEPVSILPVQHVGEAVKRGENEARLASAGVPIAHEIGHVRQRWSVVDARRVRDLGIEEVIGIIVTRFELRELRRQQVIDEVHVTQSITKDAIEIVRTVECQQSTPTRSPPPEGIQVRLGTAAAVHVD